MKSCKVKSQKLLRLLAQLKRDEKQRPAGSMDEREDALEKRFLKYVKKLPDGCWEWTATKNKIGYGQTGLGGKTFMAHRMAYMIFVGDIPEKMCVCHSCDNPPCVNPRHLWLGSNKDNVLDAMKKNRRADKSGKNNGRAKLTDKDVLKIRSKESEGVKTSELAEKYKVSISAINQIKSGKIWRNLLQKANR